MRIPSFEDVLAASERLLPHVSRTPLLNSPALDDRAGGSLLFKADSLQVTGSFKLRGAFNRLLGMSTKERCAGVVAWSAGNHGQALAYAGRKLGIATTIVMPSSAPQVKIEGTRRWGATIVLYDRETESREEIGRDIARRTGAIIVPPFDDPDIIAGQGTAALEALQDARSLGLEPDRLLCPTGGGGLIAGCALALEGLGSKAAIHSVEPEGYDDTRRSISSGSIEANEPRTASICDALMTVSPGEIPFAVNRHRLSPGLVVGDQAVMAAVGSAFLELKLVLEPGGAAGLAAAFAHPDLVRDSTTIVMLTGGNVDLPVFPSIAA